MHGHTLQKICVIFFYIFCVNPNFYTKIVAVNKICVDKVFFEFKNNHLHNIK